MALGKAIEAGRGFFRLFADDAQLVRGLRQAQRRLRNFGKSATAIGASITGIGIAAATPFALAARTFATFESSMARVKALTGAVGDDFLKLETKAKQLGATTVFSASQAAEAMGVFALAGYDVDQILASVGPALDLAAAGQLEIAEAADIAAKLMAGMGLEANQLAGAVDIMTKAMTTANTDLQMLGEAFTYVGPIAKTAGISFEEITAAIQLLSNAGIQGEMAGTTLRGMILSLTAPSAEAAAELERLGVAVKDGGGNVRGLADILADLEKSLSGVGSGDKLQSLGTIFPARQAAGAAELVGQGAEALRDATKALNNSAGTAGRIAGTQLDTLKGDFIILLSALEGVAIAIGEAFGTELRGAIRGVSAFLSTMAGFIEANKTLALVIAGIPIGLILLGTTVAAIGVAVVTVGFMMAAMVPVVGALGAVFSVLGAAISALASPLGILSAGVIAVGLAFIDWQFVMNAVVDFIYKKFGQIAPFVVETFNLIAQAIAGGNFKEAVNVMFAGMQVSFQVGMQELFAQWNAFGLSISLVWIDVTESIQSAAANLFTGLQQRLVTLQASWKYLMAIMKGDTVDWLQALADAAALTGDISALANANESLQGQLRTEANEKAAAALGEYVQSTVAAEANLQAAMKAFADARQAIVSPEIPQDDLGDLQDKLRQIAGEAIGTSKGSVVSGGFNTAALARSFAGTEQKRTAKATEQTAKNTEKMLNNWINPLLVQ